MAHRCLLIAAVVVSVGTSVHAEKLLPESAVRRTGSVTAFFAGWSAQEHRIHEALEDDTTFNFVGTPLIDVAEYISRQHDFPLLLDVAELEKAGVLTDEPVNLTLSDVSLRSAMRLMLRNMKADFMVKRDVLIVTTADQVALQTTTRTYPVCDLIPADNDEAWDELAEAVKSASGTTWSKDESVVPVASLSCLVVTQNQLGHESVVRLLDALRGA